MPHPTTRLQQLPISRLRLLVLTQISSAWKHDFMTGFSTTLSSLSGDGQSKLLHEKSSKVSLSPAQEMSGVASLLLVIVS